jgi:hypothetical protein
MRAGTVDEITKTAGDWVFVDIGFSRESKTSGLLVNDGQPIEVTFNDLRQKILQLTKQDGPAINLVIEAPLSVAFTGEGNPAGRSIERKGTEHRYWYAGLGCQVTLAAAYLLRSILVAQSTREIRLFEAFVSFKSKDVQSSHAADVISIRSVVWNQHRGNIIAPEKLAGPHTKTMESAFTVFGFDCGIPPVIIAGV